MSAIGKIISTTTQRRTRSAAARFRLLVHSLDHALPIDLSSYLVSVHQVDRMTAPYSSWVATMKLPNRQSLLGAVAALTDDDWVTIDQSLAGLSGPWEPLQVGLVDGVRTAMVVDEKGAERWTLTLSGRGWAKVLTDTMVASISKFAKLGYAGTILTVDKLFALVNQMADAAFNGTPPSTVLSELLMDLLKGQWTVPASLLRQYMVAGSTPSDTSFSDAFWLLLRPAVQTGGAEEVDGTVWRGLSLAGGVRGTLWQLLSSCQSDPALVELWPGWTREDGSSGAKLRPVVYFRKRPFVEPSWSALPMYRLSLDDVTAMDLGKSGLERWNVGMAAPSLADQDTEQLLVNVSGLPYLNEAGIRRHGTRSWFITDSLSPFDGWIERAERQTQFLRDAYEHAPELLNGTITASATTLAPSMLGCRLRLADSLGSGLIDFYCEGLDTKFEVGPKGECSVRQTVTVTRGRQVQQ